ETYPLSLHDALPILDGSFVDGRVRAFALDKPEHHSALRLDDGECVGRRRAQTELSGRIVASGPHVAALGQLELGQQRGTLERLLPECLAIGLVDRRLERRRAYMTV